MLGEQVHNSGWHPVPQYSAVLPQYLLAEQRLPKDEQTQVWPPLAAPQRPSVEGFTGDDEGMAEEVVVDVVVNIAVPVVDVSFVPNTISMVYTDFEVSFTVVVNVPVSPAPHDSGVYKGGLSGRVEKLQPPSDRIFLKPDNCKQLPLILNGANVNSSGRRDQTQGDMRVGREIYGGDLHVQAGTVEVVSFKVADVDVLGRGIACDDVCSAVRDTAVFARS